jgi:hypothetical protein
MSLNGFYAGMAAMISDPDLVRQIRRGDTGWLGSYDLEAHERDRLLTMAGADGMEVMCTLYRATRLAPLLRTVPDLVTALGDRLHAEVSAFWVACPRTDLQFRREAEAFCDFVRLRHPGDEELSEAVARSEAALAILYEGSAAP